MAESPDDKRALLRHTLATLAYRGGKALRGAPEAFGEFRIAPTSRAPVQILAHIGDLLDWGLALARGSHTWRDSEPLPWPDEMRRFFRGLVSLDAFLASDVPLGASPERLFQGPIADAFTHVGQIGLLRRAAGSPVRGENYYKADVTAGRTGPEQSAPRFEFD